MKSQRIAFTKVICFLCMFFILDGCSSSPEKAATRPEKTIEQTKPALHTVEITQMKFNPAVLTVKKGDKVKFVNHDMVAHDITEETKKAWSSSPLPADQAWELVVTESVQYFCSIHPVMKGSIVVE